MESIEERRGGSKWIMTWADFVKQMNEKYIPEIMRDNMVVDLGVETK